MNRDFEASLRVLLESREEIDALDVELLRLISQRAEIACRLSEIKRVLGRSAYDADRERLLLSRICEKNNGPLDQDSVVKIFGSIITECRRMQELDMHEVAGEIQK